MEPFPLNDFEILAVESARLLDNVVFSSLEIWKNLVLFQQHYKIYHKSQFHFGHIEVVQREKIVQAQRSFDQISILEQIRLLCDEPVASVLA